jgi:hypothetical protein
MSGFYRPLRSSAVGKLGKLSLSVISLLALKAISNLRPLSEASQIAGFSASRLPTARPAEKEQVMSASRRLCALFTNHLVGDAMAD